jgi:hypothetical protein
MKKIILYVAALVMSVALNTSCDKMRSPEGPDYVVSYGILIDDGVGYRNCIVTDSGLKMYIYETNITQQDINNQKERVLANYTILEGPDSYGDYYIRLNGFYALLTDEIPPISSLTEDQKKNLGEDPIYVTTATISGDYLNMPLVALYNSSSEEVAHKIQLVFNDKESTEHNFVFELYHNAYTDKNGSTAIGRYSSFPLKRIVPQDPTKPVGIELRWRWYHGSSVNDCVVGGTYYPGSKESVVLQGTYGSQM